MSRRPRNLWICLFTLIALVGLAPAGAAEVATMSQDASNIIWQPTAKAASYQLTVSGPSGIFTSVFAADEVPVFGLFDGAGNALADGSYTYELRALPVVDADMRAAMERARADGTVPAGRLPQGSVQVGYFAILGGSFAIDAEEVWTPPAPSADKDQVILDDLIVTQSACIGQDCVNGESFGFDTLRLKENNLRIKFQDTSNSASFPSNDWQLTANDSTNGGANKFSVDDIDGGRTPFTIEASAPSHSLYVDDGGRIGLGTSTPVVEVHVVNGDSPTIRLEQDGSSGFTPQTWDVAGNETNFFVRDATNGSRLPFKIVPAAPTNSIYVAADGDIGLGTASPDADLHVIGTVGVKIAETDNGTSPPELLEIESTTDNGARIRFDDGTGQWNMGGGASTTFFISDTGDGVSEFILTEGGNLTIAGTLTATTAGMTDSFPDYVFEDDYELMSLADLEAFIDEQGHLPRVPSAQDIEDAGGVNMSELQLRMLEKIEELTLHTIQQQKLIESLQAREEEACQE